MPTSAKTAAKKATAKKATVKTAAPVKKAASKVAAKKVPAKKAVVAKKAVAAKKTTGALAPIKDTFTKASLATHLSERAAVDVKAVKAVLVALEDTILGSIHKKGAGEFTLSGLLKITAQTVAAKKKRFGKDPFTGTERWFPAKPASVRIKARALKKLKDAAA
ncbi:HU family DNA-binding protein [Caballeronia sp. GAFFF2]|uniref:HU family DNA-binding protein n=1 Tax=Caballeronia sp. GAFFF2 TaxID=2921741 RepID=UPI0020280A01|nr:HU family DNA-binding protein [Caballeronia sp. GAFFF2]